VAYGSAVAGTPQLAPRSSLLLAVPASSTIYHIF